MPATSQTELTWDQRIFALIDPGIDGSLIDENLRLTPTERVERMEALRRELEEMREYARADQPTPR